MARTRGDLTKQVTASKKPVKGRRQEIDINRLIPSGITLLNCACSDNPFGAFGLGTINTLPGGSVGGKTMEALTMLAECANSSRFDEYDLLYDDGEEALAIDIPYLFGDIFYDRLTYPDLDDNDEAVPSETIQDFKAQILTRCKKGTPFIYVLDSLDSLTTDEEIEKEYKKALAKAKSSEAVTELKGSYKTEKAKHLGEALRMINGSIKKSESTLFIVQQERAKIGVTFGKKTTTSGGKAPFYYSSHQCWFNKLSAITDEVGKIKRKTGTTAKIEVTKNKITGKQRTVDSVNIYYDYGIDDITCCVDFLIKAGHWRKISKKDSKKPGNTIDAHDLDLQGMKGDLVKLIENEQAEKEMKVIVGKVWNNIEESMRLDRKRRYE